MDAGEVVSNPVAAEGVLPPLNDLKVVTVLESSNFVVIKKFGPVDKAMKNLFKMVKDSVTFSGSVHRAEEMQKSVLVNALLKFCTRSKEDFVELGAFMEIYKDTYGEPLLHEGSTVDDIMKYFKNTELLSCCFRIDFFAQIPVIYFRSQLGDDAVGFIGQKGTPDAITVTTGVPAEKGPEPSGPPAVHEAAHELGSHARRSSGKAQAPANAVTTAGGISQSGGSPAAPAMLGDGGPVRPGFDHSEGSVSLDRQMPWNSGGGFGRANFGSSQAPASAAVAMRGKMPIGGFGRQSFGHPKASGNQIGMVFGKPTDNSGHVRRSFASGTSAAPAPASAANPPIEVEYGDGLTFTERQVPIPAKKWKTPPKKGWPFLE